MYTTSGFNTFNRTGATRSAADLRRAGYHDGEPAPRVKHHWANQPSSVKAHSRIWRKRRTER
ncbi:MAG TPA: hypothetical protein PLT07_04755, partial [Trueperaceae bacterium]|nr:hypothetical protein [Trueperaceae bacterium]